MCRTLKIIVVLFSEQLSGYCNLHNVFIFSLTEDILEMASFMRDDTVNPILSSI